MLVQSLTGIDNISVHPVFCYYTSLESQYMPIIPVSTVSWEGQVYVQGVKLTAKLLPHIHSFTMLIILARYNLETVQMSKKDLWLLNVMTTDTPGSTIKLEIVRQVLYDHFHCPVKDISYIWPKLLSIRPM